tara:strand:- start:5236 stop:5517 length:282 start_codon:yes stop_codon:yes gene_type:complete
MRNYIYKVLILCFFLFVVYEFTIGKEIDLIKKEFINKISSYESDIYKEKVRDNIKNLLKKDRILYEEDAKLLSDLLKKIFFEINFSNDFKQKN